MTRARLFWYSAPVLLAVALVGGNAAHGQIQEQGAADPASADTPFTYEGRLIFGGEPVSGNADFRFLLFDDPAGGERHGPVLEWPDGALHRGWFEVELDFGVDLHDGTPRWLEVQVRAPAGEGDFEPLRPRQAVLPMLAARQSILNLDGEPRVFGEDANEPRTGAGAGADPADPRFADTLPGGFGDDPIGPPPGGGGRPDGDRGAQPAGGDGGPRQSLWAMTGQHIYNTNAGSVGVGTQSPNPISRLHVNTGLSGGWAVNAWSGGSGATVGLRGAVDSPSGTGVIGRNWSSSGPAIGVRGLSDSSDGRGVDGFALSQTGSTIGVRGGARSPGGAAIRGRNFADSGLAWGVHGITDSPDGRGVEGVAASSSGTNYGVYGRTDSSSGYAGYFEGGRNYFQGNVGIGIQNPTAALHIQVGRDVSLSGIRLRYLSHPDPFEGPGPSVVAGHSGNSGSVVGATVAGGGRSNVLPFPGGTSWPNVVEAPYGTISGGANNTVAGSYGVIAGGQHNVANGWASFVAGGGNNDAMGDYSFAAGRRAKANHDGAFVLADSTNANFASFASNRVRARFSNGYWLYTNSDATLGVRVSGGGTSWSSISDRDLKHNVAPVDTVDVLQRLAAIPVTRWTYIDDEHDVPHMGPMAQDFHAAFGLGDSERHISTLNADGVAFAAIQGLYELVQEKDEEIESLRAQNEELSAQNAQLHERLAHIERIFGIEHDAPAGTR